MPSLSCSYGESMWLRWRAKKRGFIARERVLEWVEPIESGLDAVGGLENLKQWLLVRSTAYSAKARAYGPSPRGILLAGIPGCGKSLTPKALAKAWKCPLLRLDMGALKSKFVGESEGNLRKALKVAEATGKCILWIDEIEKALQGASSGASDGGVSSDALGALLSWMQERTSETFIVATANDAEILPPELMRRFDKIWWIDLPTLVERTDILAASLRFHKRGDVLEYADWSRVAAACEGFTGAEVADLVPTALFTAFADDGRELTAGDLLDAAKSGARRALEQDCIRENNQAAQVGRIPRGAGKCHR